MSSSRFKAAALLSGFLLIMPIADAAAFPVKRGLLQGLDKITAKVSKIELAVGESVDFGSLTIELKACDKAPPEETPESAAFLKITEHKPGEPPIERFSGWMFASSPAISAMEHPVYDVRVLDCLDEDSNAAKAPEQPKPTPSEGEALPETTD